MFSKHCARTWSWSSGRGISLNVWTLSHHLNSKCYIINLWTLFLTMINTRKCWGSREFSFSGRVTWTFSSLIPIYMYILQWDPSICSYIKKLYSICDNILWRQKNHSFHLPVGMHGVTLFPVMLDFIAFVGSIFHFNIW